MKQLTLSAKLLCALALAAAVAAAAPPAHALTLTADNVRALPSKTLRGYGAVSAVEFIGLWGHPEASATVFSCATSADAATVVGKFLADLSLSSEVKTATLTLAGHPVPATVTPEGAIFIGCVEAKSAWIVTSTSADVLSALAAAHPDLVQGAVARAPYPHYLDRFDRYGWGCYGMNGFNDPGGYLTWGQEKKLDPTEDVDFMAEHGFRFEGWLDPDGMDNSDGIIKNTQSEWEVQRAGEEGLDVSFRLYGNAGGADWTERRFPEYAEQPASFLMSGWHGEQEFFKAQPHLTWYDLDIQRYMAVKAQDMMKEYVNTPNVMGWMHPQGELAHDAWYDLHDNYSPEAARSWRTYLQGHGVSLAQATRMYHHSAAYADWSQVPIPEFATFAGLGGSLLDLSGVWHYRLENTANQAPPDSWYSLPADQEYAGISGQWWQAPLDSNWPTMNMPGSDMLFGIFPGTNNYATSWWRRDFTLTAAQKALPKIYLYWFPISPTVLTTGPRARYHGVWINGQPAGEMGVWGALEVSGLLRAGDNQIALHLLGSSWDGRIFLSTDPPAIYPYLGADMNRLWLLWRAWHNDSKFSAWWDILDAMRQVDPNRPIKFMAPLGMGADRYLQLATRWGGFGHFTGEGIWMFPWYKRYGWLYDVPGSSETGGPMDDVEGQFQDFRRVFLEGINAHDPVFVAQTYTRNPPMRQWWIDHDPVLQRMGKADIDGPQVLLYRSERQTGETLCLWEPYPKLGEKTREIQDPWNWDIGRGTLQTLGQSYLYLDDGGITDGKMRGFPLIVDGGNEALPPAVMQSLSAWVRAGGTYVTLPFTGRSSYEQPDTWPVRALTGCEIGKLRTPGAGTVTFLPNQTVFRALAGKSFPDQGKSIDFQGGSHDLLGVELKPGPDCEVLATFEDGSPAIVKHKLGAGTVIVLGTAFWRSSQDILGLWWPQPIETDFVGDLLNGVGFPAASCTTDDRLVWPQPYRTNNGLSYSTTVVNWHDDQDADTTLTLRLPRKPERLVSYGVNGVVSLPFSWVETTPNNGVAAAKLHLPAKEVKVVTAEVYSPESAVAHWWGYQEKMWHQLATPQVNLQPYREGKWVDPTVDLRFGAQLTTQPQTGNAWTQPGPGVPGWTPCDLGLLNSEGALPNQPVWARKQFTFPVSWLADGGQTLLVSACWSGPQYLGSAQMYLNGKMLHDWTQSTFNEFDVTAALLPGPNMVGFAFKGDAKYQGFCGNVYLYHRAKPLQSIDLTAAWAGINPQGQPATLTLPGQGMLQAPTRSIMIPQEWQGKYQVRLYMIGDPYSVNGVFLNDRLVRRHHHHLGTRADVDLTNYLKFGQENTFRLAYGGEYNGPVSDLKQMPRWNLSVLRLDLFPAIPSP